MFQTLVRRNQISGIALRLPVVVFIASLLGCTGGTGRLNLSDQQRAELQHIPLIQTVHWRQGDGIFVSYAPGPASPAFTHGLLLSDPIDIIKEQVSSQLMAQSGLTNIRSVPTPVVWRHQWSLLRSCCIRDGMTELEETFGDGYVLDFASRRAFLDERDPFNIEVSSLWISDAGMFNVLGKRFNLYYQARARLIRLKASTVVWQGQCSVGSLDARSEWREQAEWGMVFMVQQLAIAGNKCAAQLVEQFHESSPNLSYPVVQHDGANAASR